MALEPITRQEKIIAGQDLTPITRMEKFLKEFGGSGGSGGGVVEIPITWNDDQEDFTVGNTFADMRKAVDGGSTVVLKDNLGRRYHLQRDEGGGLTFTNIITNMNSMMIFLTFSFGVDGYERFYSEIVTTQEDLSVIHSVGE